MDECHTSCSNNVGAAHSSGLLLVLHSVSLISSGAGVGAHCTLKAAFPPPPPPPLATWAAMLCCAVMCIVRRMQAGYCGLVGAWVRVVAGSSGNLNYFDAGGGTRQGHQHQHPPSSDRRSPSAVAIMAADRRPHYKQATCTYLAYTNTLVETTTTSN
jgi:hypothetical protein